MTHTTLGVFVTSMHEAINNEEEVYFMMKSRLMQAVKFDGKKFTYKDIEEGKEHTITLTKNANKEVTSLN